MSCEISLFDAGFLRRALAEHLGDWTDADPLPPKTIALVRERLVAGGYTTEFEDGNCQEWTHPNENWHLQVSIFPNQIAYSIPYGKDFSDAVKYARQEAKELAALTGLGYYDEEGETEMC